MSFIVYVPSDSGAVSLGANRIAAQLATEASQRNIDLTIIRNGSRGMYWLEPMVEVATPTGRVAYGPVKTNDVSRSKSFGKYTVSLIAGY